MTIAFLLSGLSTPGTVAHRSSPSCPFPLPLPPSPRTIEHNCSAQRTRGESMDTKESPLSSNDVETAPAEPPKDGVASGITLGRRGRT